MWYPTDALPIERADAFHQANPDREFRETRATSKGSDYDVHWAVGRVGEGGLVVFGRGLAGGRPVDAWAVLRQTASIALRSVLDEPYVAGRSTLGSRERTYIVQKLEELVAERILSPLLRVGEPAWDRLATEVADPRRLWSAIRAAWIVPTYPEAWQAEFWQRYVKWSLPPVDRWPRP
jgi:hypothetical protein